MKESEENAKKEKEQVEAPATADQAATGENPVSSQVPAPALGGMLSQLTGEQFSLMEAIGGVRGIAEATLPTVLLIALYPFTRTLFWPLVAAFAVTVITAGARLLQRSSLRQVLTGLLGTAVGALWAWKTGQATNFFALGFWINGVYGAGLLATIAMRTPAVGWLLSVILGCRETWRTRDGGRFYRAALWSTWAWVVLFSLRLAVELPLFYLDQLIALGVARLLLGLPAFALVGWLNWAWLSPRVRELKTGPESVS